MQIKLKLGFSTNKLNNALLKLDREVLSWIFLEKLFHRFKPDTVELW